jgi:hypothetical protein
LCGPIAYSILEGYSFVSITSGSDPGEIRVQTNLISALGDHTATFNARLTKYPNVTNVKIVF